MNDKMKWLAPRLGFLLLPLLVAAVWLTGAPTPDAHAQDGDDLPPARIEQLPTWHGGSLFTFQLHFADDTNLSFRTVRDDLFQVDGGRVTRAPRIDKSSNQGWLVHVRPSGFGDVTISGLDMTATVPGPGDRLVARISELPSSHDGEEEFTARLDFNREPDLKPRDVRGPVVVVTGGDVVRSPRVVKGSNLAWTLMVTPDGDGTVGIAIPVTGSCGNEGDVCMADGTQLADGAWRTVRGPDRDTLARPANTIGNTDTQPTIRPEEPAQTEPEGPTGADHNSAETECAHTLSPTATSFTYNLDCDDQLTQFLAYLNHPSKSHSYTQHRAVHKLSTGNWATGSDVTYSAGGVSNITLPFSGTAVTYDVCVLPTGITQLQANCEDDSSGHSSGTRGELRVISLSAPLTLSSPGNLTFIEDVDISPVSFPAARGGAGSYDYEIVGTLPWQLTFGGTNGRTLSGFPHAAAAAQTFTYKVTDGNGVSRTASFSITIEALVLPNPGDVTFQKGAFRSVQLGKTNSGLSETDETYNVVPGSTVTPLPAGLSFDEATRTLSGTPTAKQDRTEYSYTVALPTSDGNRIVNFHIAVIEVINVPAVSDVYATVGVPISVTLPAVTDPTATTPITYGVMGAPYNWGNDWPDGPANGPGLPAGLSFNPDTRVLSGTPQHTVGARRLAYGAVDKNGARGASEFELRVREPLTLAQPDDFTVADGEAMVPVNLPRAEGGHSTYPDGYTYYDYSVSGLPFGLRYERFQHQIYGTPSYSRPPREVEVTLTATDVAGTTLGRTFTITMLECSLTLDPVANRTYHAGTAIDPVVLPVGRGACGDVSYELNGLPDGLEFDPDTRTLSGTPADFDGNQGNYLRQVQYVATDDEGSKTVEFTIVVPTVASVCGPNRDAARGWNGDYDTNLDLPDPDSEAWFKTNTPNGRFTLPAATGGQEPYTYVVRGLPNGVCFDPATRAVYGTPPFTQYPTVHWYFPDYLVQDASGDSRENYFVINVYD